LGGVDDLGEFGEVGTPGDEVPLDEVDAIAGRNMHEGAFVGLLLDCFGGVDVPDVVGVGEVQQRGFGGDGGHETPATGDGEVDAAMLAFEAADELMDGVESAIGTHLVYDVIEGLIFEQQDMRAEVDGLPADSIAVTDELGVEAVDCMLQAWLRSLRVNDDDLADGETALEQEVEREGHDLGLAAQGCQ